MNKSGVFGVVMFLVILFVSWFVYMIPVSDLPFGDVDSSTHFGLGDNVGQNLDFGLDVPYYLDFNYGFANDHKMWYHPLLPYMIGVSQIVSGSRIFVPFAMIALLCSLFIPFTYLLIKKVWGFWPALISVPMLLFSFRDFMTYSWGLWPERISYALIPLALVLFWSYSKKRSWVTLAYCGVVVGLQTAFHIQGAMLSLLSMGLYFVYLSVKEKKLAVKLSHLIFPVVIIVLFMVPSFSGLMNYNSAMGNSDGFKIQELGSLFSWYPPVPYSPIITDVFAMYHLTFAFIIVCVLLFVGIGFYRREWDKTVFMFIPLVALYLLMHLNVIGFGDRTHRFVSAEAIVLLPLVAIGIYLLLSWLTKQQHNERFTKIAAGMFFVILAVWCASGNLGSMTQTYPEQLRINEYQLEACDWVRMNLSEDAHVRIVGTPIYYERKWIQVLCQRHMIFDDVTYDGSESEFVNMTTHIMIDNTISLYGPDGIKLRGNETPLFSNGVVEVYKR